MRWILLVAGLTISGCASVMSEDECASADWYGIGERDGLYGEAPDKLTERADRCASFGINADIAAYDAGRARGLKTYCTPEAGYDAGRNGRPYHGVCPADAEADFLAEYNIGYRLFELSKARDDAIAAYDNALSSIESHRHNLREARKRHFDESLTPEEREKAGDDIDYNRREIDRLEYSLPRLEAEIDTAEGRLEDYRAFVDRRTR